MRLSHIDDEVKGRRKGENHLNSSIFINIFVVVLLLIFIYIRFGPTKGLRTLKAMEFQREIEQSSDRMLIDVREPSEYKNGHIPGAKNFPLSQISHYINDIPNDQDIFLYCKSGMRSKNAALILRKNGYTRLNHLQGGIGSWRGEISK